MKSKFNNLKDYNENNKNDKILITLQKVNKMIKE